jgi:hypothetical protein
MEGVKPDHERAARNHPLPGRRLQASPTGRKSTPLTIKMITFDHHTLRLFDIPIFTLVVGIMFFVALAVLCFGISRWRQPVGKIAVFSSVFILLLFTVAIVLVLITVGSGSMG